MTLDEAIQHADEKGQGTCQCHEDHRQLADWLRELKAFREKATPIVRVGPPHHPSDAWWRRRDHVSTYPRTLVTELPPGFSTDEENGAK